MATAHQIRSKLAPTLTWLGGGLLLFAALLLLFVPMVESCAYLAMYPPINLWCRPMETVVHYRGRLLDIIIAIAAMIAGLVLFANEGRRKIRSRFDFRWLVIAALLVLLLADWTLGIFFAPGGICLLLAVLAGWLLPVPQ